MIIFFKKKYGLAQFSMLHLYKTLEYENKSTFLILFSASIFTATADNTPKNTADEMSLVNGVVLGQNYPNPAKGKTVILVDFTSSEAVLSIYNVLGKLVEQHVISNNQKE